MIFTDSSSSSSSSSKRITNSITVAVLDPANRFSSDLVHRHIIFPLTLLLLEKLMITGPDNT